MHKKAFGKLARNFTVLSLAAMFLAWLMWFLEVEGDLPLQVRVGPAIALRIALGATLFAGLCAMVFVTWRSLFTGLGKAEAVLPEAIGHPWAKELTELEHSLEFYESELRLSKDTSYVIEPRRRRKYERMAESLREEIGKIRQNVRVVDRTSSNSDLN